MTELYQTSLNRLNSEEMYISEVNHNYIIIEGIDSFTSGLLFPHNIHYQGHPIGLPFSMSLMEEVKRNQSLLENCTVISSFGHDGRFALLALDCVNLIKGVSLENTLLPNKNYKGTVIANDGTSTIVSVNGQYGFIEGPVEEQVGDSIHVSPVELGSSKLEITRFSRVVSAESRTDRFVEASSTINDFLNKEEDSVISQADKATIEWLLDNTSGITRKNINVVQLQLDLYYRASAQLDLHTFLSENPHYFEERNFWLSCYKDEATNDTKLIIYDVSNIVMEVAINDRGMWITEFSHNKSKTNAQFLIDRNQRALVIPGRNIIIHPDIFVKDDYVETGEIILAQYEVAKKILPRLAHLVKKEKERAGVDYLILRELLSFQEQKEKDLRDELSISINAEDLRITTSTDSEKPAIEILNRPDVGKLFAMKDSDECHIELLRGEEKPLKAILKESEKEGAYLIEFFHSHFSPSELSRSGIEIRRQANINHLKLQQEAIDGFVYGKDEFDIFRKLKQGELSTPEPDMTVSFFDEKFNAVEDGNNQPLAIRKAVNNQDILLIQGPPGTGKTSVIVEIIKQLVINKKERVLVCSQAHSAVKNIFDRLVGCDERIRIGNIDEEETMVSEDIKDHPEYLRNNMLLLNELQKCSRENRTVEKSTLERYLSGYSTPLSKTRFLKEHDKVVQYFSTNQVVGASDYNDILNELRLGLLELGEDAIAFNNARHYQSLNVLMGTCIGIGMDYGLQRSGLIFDTVIIDEAGKANLAEATVPMRLGKKYILVGDQRQLPPYMDREEIKDFIENSDNQNLEQKEVESAISYSLFEDFLQDENFPQGNTVLLNYQYRMNPEIGDYISELFYDGKLLHGRGTEKQRCVLDGYSNAVTFIDTSTKAMNNQRNIAYEQGSAQEGWYNSHEIDIILDNILPKLSLMVANDPTLTVGFITPYRRQRHFLLNKLKDTYFKGCVYTIDSIQGTEFDVVVLSLVRAFDTRRKNRTVGFLDDMRRLNVALSRAKKKLIVLGNLDTLCAKSAHMFEESNSLVSPVKVFRKLREIKVRDANKTSLKLLKDAISQGSVSLNQIFKDCRWNLDKNDYLTFCLELNNNKLEFPLPYNEMFQRYGLCETRIDVKLLEISDKTGRARFRYLPKADIATQIADGIVDTFTAQPIEWIEGATNGMVFRLEDGAEIQLEVSSEISKEDFFLELLDCPNVDKIDLRIYDNGTVNMNSKVYEEFSRLHRKGDVVSLLVIDDHNPQYYIVRCGNVYGKVNKFHRLHLNINQKVQGRVFKVCNRWVNFSVN